MTGLPEFNFPAFHAAARKLRELGYEVANPAEINSETGGDWHYYLRADIKALCDCDTLALLPGWEGSKGAHLELHVAHRLGMEVMAVEKLVGPNAEVRGDAPLYGAASLSTDGLEGGR